MIVVDASVALQWIAPERDGQTEAESVLAEPSLHAPELLVLEVANALRKKLSRGEVGEEQAFYGLETIRQVVSLHPVSAGLGRRAMELSIEMAHPVYDCLYLALAEALGGKVATRDLELSKRLIRAGYGHRLEALPIGGAFP